MSSGEIPSISEHFGDPITVDEHTTFIPVSRRGLFGRPVAMGAFTISDGTATWTPIVDQGGSRSAAWSPDLSPRPWARQRCTSNRRGRR